MCQKLNKEKARIANVNKVPGGLCRAGSGGRQPYKVHRLLKGHFFTIKAFRPLILQKKKKKKMKKKKKKEFFSL